MNPREPSPIEVNDLDDEWRKCRRALSLASARTSIVLWDERLGADRFRMGPQRPDIRWQSNNEKAMNPASDYGEPPTRQIPKTRRSRNWWPVIVAFGITVVLALGFLWIGVTHRDNCVKASRDGCTILPWSGSDFTDTGNPWGNWGK
jgi:hypothetical protein